MVALEYYRHLNMIGHRFPLHRRAGSFGRAVFLAALTMFIGALTLPGCSVGHHAHLHAGASDYSHYPEGGGLAVSVAWGPDGRLWRVVPEKHHVYVDSSTDLGKTFSAPVAVNAEAQKIRASGENRPGIAVDRAGNIYVIYSGAGSQPSAVYFSMSSDGGSSFSTPVPVNEEVPGANAYQGRLAVGADGKVYVFWHDERDRTDWQVPGNAIYAAATLKAGGPELRAEKVSDSVCDCCRIASAFDVGGQPVLVTRFIYPGGIRDHGLAKRSADGKTWSAWRVSFDDWKVEACPEHGPALSVGADGRYHMVWFTQGTARRGLFYANSVDQGKHFGNPMPVGNLQKLPSHPDIVAQGSRVVLVWKEFDGTTSKALTMQSADGGAQWSSPQVLAESLAETDYPLLSSDGSRIFLSWNTKEGYRLIPIH
jgi:hypothetical protein